MNTLPPLKQRLESVHPEYLSYINRNLFQSWDDQFHGKGPYLTGAAVIRHPRESDRSYARRMEFAKYVSHAKLIADDWIARLFGPDMILSLDQPSNAMNNKYYNISAWESDMDLLGSDIVEIHKNASRKALALGMSAILTLRFDPTGNGEIVNLWQEEDAGIRPYSRVFRPDQIRNWNWDRNGLLQWVLLREPTYLDESFAKSTTPHGYSPLVNPYSGAASTVVDQYGAMWRYLFVTRESIKIWHPVGIDSWETETYSHNLGYVPLARFYWERPEPFEMFRRPVMEPIYGLQDLIYQLRSGTTEIVVNQSHSIFVMSAMSAPQTSEGEEGLKIGSQSAIRIGMGAQFPPFFASPSADLPEVHMRLINSLERQIHEIAKQGGNTYIDDGKSREASGRAKSYDVEKLGAFLRSCGDLHESAVEQHLTTFWKMSTLGSEPYRGVTKFPNNFHLRGVLEEADEAMALCHALAVSPTACKVALRRLAESAMRSDLSREDRESILEEINEADPALLAGMVETIHSSIGDGDESPPKTQEIDNGGRIGVREIGSAEQTGPTLRRVNRIA